ncbi:MAG: ABC transporter permease [Actinomycetota bacterium]|nr:ABC transporter permease [Actinomycetota bacterium]
MASARRSARGEGFSPAAIMSLAAVAALFFLLPLLGLALRAPWAEAWNRIRQPEILDALRLSTVVSLSALGMALAFGAPLAWVLANVSFPGRRLLRGLILLPMVLPPVVAGVGLLIALGRRGILGGVLAQLGVSLPFTTPAAAVAAAFVGAPFLVVTLEAGFRSVDKGLEDAASTLGASRWMIFRTVTLPAVRPSLVAGATLCWARALGEFGATIIFAGNLRGVTQTGPLAVYEELQTGDPGGAILLSLVLLLISLTVLVALRGRVSVR